MTKSAPEAFHVARLQSRFLANWDSSRRRWDFEKEMRLPGPIAGYWVSRGAATGPKGPLKVIKLKIIGIYLRRRPVEQDIVSDFFPQLLFFFRFCSGFFECN